MGNLFKETIVSNLKSALENYEDENDGYHYEEVNVEVDQNPSYLPDPVELDWDAEEVIVAEEVVVTDWERHNNYVQYDFGINFKEDGDDEDNLWSALKSKADESLWPFGNSAAGWGKHEEVFQDYILRYVEDHDAHLDTKIYLRWTWPVQDPEDESTYITYHVAVAESEGLVRIRPYTGQFESATAAAAESPEGYPIEPEDSATAPAGMLFEEY
jgi:hypothetical protein